MRAKGAKALEVAHKMEAQTDSATIVVGENLRLLRTNWPIERLRGYRPRHLS